MKELTRGAELELTSRIFKAERIPELSGETVVRGGRHLLALLARALVGVEQIGVIGWGPQARAQAQNLRDSLEGTGIQVVVGLRRGSGSPGEARAAGFDEDSGTLGEMFEVMRQSQLVLLLISDAAQAQLHGRLFDALRPGSTLGLSHGFLLAYLRSIGASPPASIDLIGVCPKGMGPSVRRLYLQGLSTPGAGINCSIAVEQDATGRALERALAWAIALGAPCCFATSLERESRSDIFGERGILLGALHGIVESLYRYYRGHGMSPHRAFACSSASITGPISRTISERGLLGLYADLDGEQRPAFDRAYCSAYQPALELLSEVYDEVALGNEIQSVIAASERLDRFPLRAVDCGEMWRAGRELWAMSGTPALPLHPTTAGVYCGVMMAQIDLLLAHGHSRSEVVNESVIEAVDSLNPTMHARGVAAMVDGCSTTARIGCRKWAPRFDDLLTRWAYPAIDDPAPIDARRLAEFHGHEIHAAIRACAGLRPTLPIAVAGQATAALTMPGPTG